mgnify:CR=1 FL=1
MMLSTFSKHIASCLGKNLESDQVKIEIYAYGLEILLGAAIKLLIILALAWALNALNTTLILLVTYAALRWFGGGAHMSTYLKCLLLGTTLIVGMGSLSRFNLGTNLLANLSILTLAFASFVCFRWVPGDTEKKTISARKIRLRQKRKFAVMVAVWGFANLYMLRHSLNTYALAMNLGCLSSVFLITPWGYKSLALIDKLSKRGGVYDEGETTEVCNECSGRSPSVHSWNRSGC